MRGFREKLFLTTAIAGFIFLFSFHQGVQAQEEKLFFTSLNIQSIIKGFVNKFFYFFPFVEKETYKEKYFRLLREFSKLKLKQKEFYTATSFESLKEKFPNALQVKTLKVGSFGILYLEKKEKVKKDSIVVDPNFILVGKVNKVKENYLEVITMHYPGIEFNIATLDNTLLGTGRTTGLGYIEINYIDPKIALGKDDLVMTYGQDKIFPPNFIFGKILTVEKTIAFIQATVEPIASFSDDTYFIIP